ncbi:uncharacterized protein LOC113362197 [Papaver somniferum]|uniref:uncharacterized protein LOC113362197 n=1 Tax=Papaver somniferum TaxID=3469 RepID=UPI000E6FB33E|nr:uncharacterized protein LOC113362197 [Papaver somniferum]XP_026460936.1 uncharacterized protein LOC113362197 [Papaver somniferum]XP_026460937.1 uncharacterized protein LOC113362197 [Papaver somniferum]
MNFAGFGLYKALKNRTRHYLHVTFSSTVRSKVFHGKLESVYGNPDQFPQEVCSSFSWEARKYYGNPDKFPQGFGLFVFCWFRSRRLSRRFLRSRNRRRMLEIDRFVKKNWVILDEGNFDFQVDNKCVFSCCWFGSTKSFLLRKG